MGKYISIGSFDPKLKYILYLIIFLVLKDFIFGYNYDDSFVGLSIFGDQNAHETFSEHSLIYHIICYFITFIISMILYIYENKYSKMDSQKKETKKILLNEQFPGSFASNNLGIKYIHYDIIKKYNSGFSFFILIIIVIIWILEEHLIEISTILKDLDFWMIEICIISYFNSKIFNTKIENHQKLVIIYNLIPIFLKIATIILSLVDECNKVGNKKYYNYYYNYNNHNISMCSNNEGQPDSRLQNIYVKNWWLIYPGIVIILSLFTLRAYVNTKIKWFMDLKFISPNKLLMIYGFLGTIICSIVCFITTFTKCEEISNDKKDFKDFYDYICKVRTNNAHHTYKYFDNYNKFYEDFKNTKFRQILMKIILGSIFVFLTKYYSILVIKNLTPVHLIFSFPLYYIIVKICTIIKTLIITKGHFYNNNPIHYITEKFTLDFIGDILSTLGFLVYLEIIELNFNGLNINLRRKIMQRGIKEIEELDSIIDRSDTFNDENQNEEEGIENNENINNYYTLN